MPRVFTPNKRILIIAVAVLLLIFLDTQGILEPFKDIFLRVSSPFQRFFRFSTAKVRNIGKLVLFFREVNRENQELKRINQELLAQNVMLKEIERENEMLRDGLNLPQAPKFRLVIASVTGRDPQNLGDFILIDQGRKKGIRENMAVIIGGGLLIGKVIQVSAHSAKIMIVTNINSAVHAQVQDSRATGVIKGEHGFGLLMDFISKEKEVRKGDRVITSGLGGIFPRGLVVGEINEVISRDIEPFQKAKVVPAVNIGEIERVFVIIGKE